MRIHYIKTNMYKQHSKKKVYTVIKLNLQAYITKFITTSKRY